MRKIVYIVILILFSNLGYSQLTFSDRVKYSNSATSNDKKLFLVDFWATWCAPCINVSKYLNVLQQEFPDDLYIISLSYESKDLVSRFLEKHKTELAVSVDDNRINFDNYKIKSLPHGILFNASGNIIWRGNPADLKNYMVSRFLTKNKTKSSIASFIKYNAVKEEKVINEQSENFATTKNYDFFIDDNFFDKLEPLITKNRDYTVVKGTISQVVGYLLKLNNKQIKPIIKDPRAITVYIKDGQKEVSEQLIAEKILRSMNLTLSRETSIGSVFTVSLPVKDRLFWDSKQIDWGSEERPAFMVGEEEISGDNLGIETLLYTLSNLVSKPFIIENNFDTDEVYDWNLHYKYSDLMISNLDNFGIKAKEVIREYPVYILKKRGSN